MIDRFIRPYGRGDAARIKARADFTALISDAFGEEPGEGAFTLTHNVWFPKACGGVVRERNGVYSLWGFCGDDLSRADWILIAQAARDIVRQLFASGAHRVQALARADNPAAIKYLMHLGLKSDANRLVAFGPEGEDYIMLAALKGLWS